MKWVLLLVLVVGVALAEEKQLEEDENSEGRLFNTVSGLTAATGSVLKVISSGFSLAAQIVILVALILLISTLKKAKDDIGYGGYDYDYYQAPAYEHSGYDQGGSSYAAGYTKRSADFPSFLSMPVIQRLTEKVHRAIESFSEQQH